MLRREGDPSPERLSRAATLRRWVRAGRPSTTSAPRVLLCGLDARGEPLAATASRVDHWILLEYRAGWRRDAVDGSLLAAELKAHLRRQRAMLGQSRVLFVRKPDRRAHRGRRVLFGTSRPGERAVVRARGRAPRGPARARLRRFPRGKRRPGNAGRRATPPGLHARQARPLLREATGVRSTTPSASESTRTASGSRAT